MSWEPLFESSGGSNFEDFVAFLIQRFDQESYDTYEVEVEAVFSTIVKVRARSKEHAALLANRQRPALKDYRFQEVLDVSTSDVHREDEKAAEDE